MKRLSLLLAAILFSISVAMAQDKPAKIVFKYDEQVFKELGFTPEQVKKFELIQKETNETAIAIRKDPALTPEQKVAKIQELAKARSERQAEQLTAEQMEKRKVIYKRIQAANAANGY
ncbi:hypothetical protein D3C87_927660 [compost metagenome]